jgi:Dynein heavy chain AAA lid domain
VSLQQAREYLDGCASPADIPFKVLQFLTTEINYGGRVTDAKDRRLINSLVLGFCNEEALQEGYAFSPGGTYATTCAIFCSCCCLQRAQGYPSGAKQIESMSSAHNCAWRLHRPAHHCCLSR